MTNPRSPERHARNQRFGVCSCGAWGDAPSDFDERCHVLICDRCGLTAHLQSSDPREADYREHSKVTMNKKGYRS